VISEQVTRHLLLVSSPRQTESVSVQAVNASRISSVYCLSVRNLIGSLANDVTLYQTTSKIGTTRNL
jgi:hypothetical protein